MQKEEIQNCDAAIWAIEEANTVINFYKTENKVKPTELGFKYDIILFRENEEDSIEAFSAIIGDPKAYVERMGRGGFNGLMFKQKVCKKKELNSFFSKSLRRWGFAEKAYKKVLRNFS